MSDIKRVKKKLNKNLVQAVKWSAAEYKHLQNLSEELKEVETEKDIDREIKELRKIVKILRYVVRSERRAANFEEDVEGGFDKLFENMQKALSASISAINKDRIVKFQAFVSQIRGLREKLKIEHDSLIKISSFYDGELKKKLNQARVEASLERELKKEHNEKKAEEIHAEFLQLIHQMQEEISDAVQWVRGLEITLKNAEKLLMEIQSYEGSITLIRHAHKEGGSISEFGINESKRLASKLYTELQTAPAGTVFYLYPSVVGRAVATRDVIEEELKRLYGEREDIKFVDVHDINTIRDSSGEFEKKMIVTGLQPSGLLGIEKTPPGDIFPNFKNLFNGDEDLIGMTWATRKKELPALISYIKKIIPTIDLTKIHPPSFKVTPEEAAIRYIQIMKRLCEITEKYFPGHPWRALFIGHNLSADFATMALLGMKISLQSIGDIGGKFREFLEFSHFEISENKISVNYRGRENTYGKGFDGIITRLNQESDERIKEWSTY